MADIEYNVEEITRAEFAVWRNSTITKYVIQMLIEQRNQILDEIMDGAYIEDHARLAAKIGEAAGLNRLIDIKYDEIGEDEESNQGV